MQRRHTRLAAAVVAALTAPAAPALFAQGSTDTLLAPVEVTGQSETSYKRDYSESPKYTAPLLDTPRSVTVVPEAVIEQTDSTTLIDALRTVPGITMGAGEGGNPVADRPILRGFDSSSNLYVNGVRDTGSQSREMFDVERIEVIKGPDSVYSGRGSGGGSINLITKTPKTENFARGSLGIGTDNYKRATVDLNRVINDGAALRLNAMVHDADIPGRNGPDAGRWGIAPSLTLGLHSPTRVTLEYYHLQSDDIPDSGIPYNGPGSGAFAGRGDGGPVDVDRDNFYGLFNRDFRKTRVDAGTVRIEHDFSDSLRLRNTTVYSKSINDYIWTNPDDSRQNIFVGMVNRSPKSRYSTMETIANQTDLSGEFRAGGLKHSYALGLELSREHGYKDGYNYTDATSYRDGTCPGVGAISDYNCTSLYRPDPNDPWPGSVFRRNTPTITTTSTRSVYGFDTIELNRQWLVNLGLRYDSYSTTATGTPGRSDPNGTNNSNFWNYQTGVVYKPVENGSVYVSYGTSSTPPGIDVGDASDSINSQIQNLAPEHSRNYEIGTKWDVLGGRLALTAAVFRSEMTNARVQTDADTFENAGEKRVDGIELGVAGSLTNKWQVFGGYTHLKSDLVDNGALNSDNNGNEFPNTPSDSFSLWTTYAVMPRLTLGGGAFYVSKVYGNVDNTRWIPSYWRFDMMAAYRVNRNLTLQLNVQNLFGKTYYDKAYVTHYVSVAPGRAAILTAHLNF